MDQTSYRLAGGAVVQARTVAEAIEAAQLAKIAAGTSGPADDPAFRGWARKRCAAFGLDADDVAGITELTAFDPTRVDGVKAGATGYPFLVAKARKGDALPPRPLPAQADSILGVVVKAEPEQQFTLTVAYPAGRADSALAADGHRDYASKAVVEQAAWSYLRNHRQIGLWHANGTEGAGTVVESYIWPDAAPAWTAKTSGGDYIVEPGDWLLGVQWSDTAWQMIKSGQIGGLSMQGRAARGTPTGAAIAALRKARAARMNPDPGGHLAKAAHLERMADVVFSPADRENYLELARQEREKAGQR